MNDKSTFTQEPATPAEAGVPNEFPKADVETALRDELLQNVELQASIYGIELPSDQAALMKQEITIDSLVAVEILCAVDPFLGFALKGDGVVREGGYTSVNDAMSHVMPRIERAWEAQRAKGSKA